MTKSFRFILPLIFFAFIIGLLWRGLSLHPNHIPSPLINKPAPAFSLPALFDKKKISTEKDFLGHITLLNVWATWCAACAEEHNGLVQLATLNPTLYFYGLNYKDNSIAAKKWLAVNGNPYRKIAVDEKGSTAIDWGVYGAPETFIIDKKGIIRYKHIGVIDRASWETVLQPLIKRLEAETA